MPEAVLRPAPPESWAEYITRKLAGYDTAKPSPIRRRVAEGLPWALGTAIPPVGAVLSGNQATHDVGRGDYGSAALNALGSVPLAGATVSRAMALAKAAREAHAADALKNYRYHSADYPPGFGTRPNPPRKPDQYVVRGTGEPAPPDVVTHDPLGTLAGEGPGPAESMAARRAAEREAADQARIDTMLSEGGADAPDRAALQAAALARRQGRINATPLAPQGGRGVTGIPGQELTMEEIRALDIAKGMHPRDLRAITQAAGHDIPYGAFDEVKSLGHEAAPGARPRPLLEERGPPETIGSQAAGPNSAGPFYSTGQTNLPPIGGNSKLPLLAATGLGLAGVGGFGLGWNSDRGQASLPPSGSSDLQPAGPAVSERPVSPQVASQGPHLRPDTDAHRAVVRAVKERNTPAPQPPVMTHNPQREDLIAKAWERYNRTENPADFVIASILMKGDTRVPVTPPDNTQPMTAPGYASGGKVGAKGKSKAKSSSGSGPDGQKKEDCVYKALEVIHHMLMHGHGPRT